MTRLPRGAEAQCGTCSEFFASTDAFDRHLASVGCRFPGDVVDRAGRPVFERISNARGPLWRRRNDREHPMASGGARQGRAQ